MLGGEAIHLGAGLGDDHFGYPPVDARSAIQAIDVVIVFAQQSFDVCVQLRNLQGEECDVGQQLFD